MSRNPPRLYVRSPLSHRGQHVTLVPEQAHYLRNVLRLGEGAGLIVFDGVSGAWEGKLHYPSKKSAEISLESKVQEQKESSPIELFFAVIKPHRLSFLIEKGVELNVGVLHPLLTEHTVIRKLNPEKTEAQIIEACEQSERLTIPSLRPLLTLQEAVLNWHGRGPLLLCDERGEGETLFKWASRWQNDSPVGILIGPEGGFSQKEFKFLDQIESVQRVSLGPAILRSETAAMAALAILALR